AVDHLQHGGGIPYWMPEMWGGTPAWALAPSFPTLALVPLAIVTGPDTAVKLATLAAQAVGGWGAFVLAQSLWQRRSTVPRPPAGQTGRSARAVPSGHGGRRRPRDHRLLAGAVPRPQQVVRPHAAGDGAIGARRRDRVGARTRAGDLPDPRPRHHRHGRVRGQPAGRQRVAGLGPPG